MKKRLFLLLYCIFLSSQVVYGMDLKQSESMVVKEKDSKNNLSKFEGVNDYKLFKVVQGILNFVDKERARANKYGVKISSSDRLIRPCYYTKSGLFLLDDDELRTPWGTIDLRGGGSGSGRAFCAFYLQVLKGFNLSYFGTTKKCCSSGKPRYSIVKNNNIDLRNISDKKFKFEKYFKNVSKGELDKMKGKNVFVDCGLVSTIYKVHTFKKTVLSSPAFFKPNNYNHTEYSKFSCEAKKVKQMWELMQKKFKSEKQ